MRPKNPLSDAFLEDHRHLTRGFKQILDAVESGDLKRARHLAEEVDRLAGPHIAFEEEVLYPELSRARGKAFANRLYGEHGTALQALQTLLQHGGPKTEEEREELMKRLQTGLDHAISCGTLLSHLTTLDMAQQKKILERLEDFRREGRRWTELANPDEVDLKTQITSS